MARTKRKQPTRTARAKKQAAPKKHRAAKKRPAARKRPAATKRPAAKKQPVRTSRRRQSDEHAVGIDVATGAQDAQVHADLSTDELEVELETEALGQQPHDRAHTPVLSGGDVQAAWDQDTGEETVGGSNPTPDQDQVDALGQAVGISYSDAEPLHTTEKVERRDEKRWELDPASDADYAERRREMDERPPRPRRRGRAQR